MRCLVTGGAGFIGSHLVDILVQQGHDVVVLDNLSTGSRANLARHLEAGEIEFVAGSTGDAELVDRLVARSDRVFHLASVVGVRQICTATLASLLENVHGCENVIGAAARHDVRLMFSSTSEIYGKMTGATSEDAERVLGPLSKSRWSYALAKSFGEVMSFELAAGQGTEIVVARLFNTVGPRQGATQGMVIPTFVRQALTGQDLTVHGDGAQTRCFCHVRDVSSAVVGLLESETAIGRAFNIGTEDATTVGELAARVIERTNSTSKIRFVSYEEAFGTGFDEVGARRPDTKAIRTELGWRPKRSLDDVIDDVADEHTALLAAGSASV